MHEMSKPVFVGEIERNISECCQLKFLSSMLTVKEGYLMIIARYFSPDHHEKKILWVLI